MSDPRIWQRLRRRTGVWIALAILGVVTLGSLVIPFLLPQAYREPSTAQFLAPSLTHPFGTDMNGRDVLYRVAQGGRISLLVGLCGAAVSLLIGTAYGLIAGYVGGKIDELMMRIVDILYSVPRLIFILVFINAFNAQLQHFAAAAGWAWLVDYSRIAILIISLGIIEWLTMARIVRGQVLALKTRPFIQAAQALGQSHPQIILRHLLPNLLGIVIVYLTLTIPAIIIDESFLSFLGLGIQAPQASWGSLLADGAASINPLKSYWWLLVFPATIMAATLLALNYLGDCFRDALDPKR